MKGKVNIVVAAGVGVLVLMFAGAAVLLGRGFNQFSSAGKKAENQFRNLESFYRRNPFPSPANVEIATANAEQLHQWYQQLAEKLAKGDLTVSERSPTMFMRRLQDTRNQLLVDAPKQNVALKPGFAFGFDRYLSGGESSLPAPEIVPRLTMQLAVVERICRLLLASRVTSLDAIEREDLEGLAQAKAATKAAGPATERQQQRPGPGGQAAPPAAEAVAYTKMAFNIDLMATESALVEALDALARDPVVIVVRTVSFRREWPDVMEVSRPAPGAAAEGAAPAPSPASPPAPAAVPDRQERMVSGPGIEKPARVRLEIDVYRFSGDEPGEST